MDTLPALSNGDPPKTAALVLVSYGTFAASAYLHLHVLLPWKHQGRKGLYASTAAALLVVTTAMLVVLSHTMQGVSGGWLPPEDLTSSRVVPLAMAVGLLWGVVLAIEYAARYATEQRSRADRERADRTAHLARLRAQLDPHFLFNTLNSLHVLAVEQSPRLPELLAEHASLLRYALYDAEGESAPLSGEIEFLRGYVGLERLRLEDEVEVRFQMDGHVGTWSVPPLLFVPLVENAFKHLDRTSLAPFVDVTLRVDPARGDGTGHARFGIEVRNRCLHGASSGDSVGGVGLANVRTRLALLRPDAHGMATSVQGDAEGPVYRAAAWIEVNGPFSGVEARFIPSRLPDEL